MIELKPMKVTIISDLLCYGPAPEPGDEIAQRITINNKGQVWFCLKTYGNYFPRKEVPLKTVRTRINADIAADIINKIDTYFRCNPVLCVADDVGDWEMELTLEEGIVIKKSGALHCCTELNEISNVIRSALPDLGVKAFGEDYDEDDDKATDF